MAIKTEKQDDGTMKVTLTNAHAEAVEKIKDDYKIKGSAGVFAFLLCAVAKEGKGSAIGFIHNRGAYYSPSNDLLKE